MLTFLLLIFILGILIFIHELGHFIMAKRAGVHIYEFALGMGPKILSRVGKDKIVYSLRAFPIGGYVQMAGEVYEDDDKIPKEDFMCNKSWGKRLSVIVAGVVMNFILAFVLLFLMALIWGAKNTEPIVTAIIEDSAIAETGIEVGDKIVEINNYNIKSWDKAALVLQLKDKDNKYDFVVEKANGTRKKYTVVQKIIRDKKEKETKVFGIKVKVSNEKGLLVSLKYAFNKFFATIEQMWLVIINLITGHLSLNALSGPVGMYSLVGESVSYGMENVIYLIALLSINLGFINILPIPAFDGGRVLFMIIEKIKGSPINSKIENICHSVCFVLLMILMFVITIKDIIKLF